MKKAGAEGSTPAFSGNASDYSDHPLRYSRLIH